MRVGAVALLLGVVWWTSLSRAAPGAAPLTRGYEGVAVAGSTLGAAAGAPVNELVLYAYRAGGAWEAVPSQVDEVSGAGSYVASEDGLLDANDELAFMAADAGEEAPPSSWPNDAAARTHPRHAIRVSDPLAPGEAGWLYLYRSPTLPRPTAGPYVMWETAAQRLTATAYTATFTDEFVGLADLSINGSTVDILDRQKLRVSGTFTPTSFPIPVPLSYNEETIRDVITDTLTLELPITGPVRAIAGSPARPSAFYASYYEIANSLPLTDTVVTIPPLGTGTLRISSLRTSLDLRDPVQSGMAPTRYYDSNGRDVAVDGAPDTVPSTPAPTWFQVDGALGGFALIQNATPANGTLQGYYLDNGTPNSNDTGDQRSFGDAGLRIDNPNGEVELRARAVVLPPGSGNRGAQLRQQADAPLVTTVEEQTYSGGGEARLYLPLVVR